MKILVIELSNVGDAILTFPALQRLRSAYPASELHLLASPRTQELFASDPRVKRVWLWQKRASPWRQLALIGRLFKERFDLVVDFRNSLIPLLLLTRRTPFIRRDLPLGVHRIDQHLLLLDALKIPSSDGGPPLWVRLDGERRGDQKLEAGRRKVVMAPGSRSHLKRWPADRFALVADRLIDRLEVQVLFVGDEEDRPVVQAVLKSMRHRAADLSGKTTLHELFSLLKKVDLVVTNDSACLHAAEAMGAPTVAIFGPTDEAKYGPRNSRSAVVRRKLVCAPCERALCPYGHECMQSLGVEEVYEAVVQILQGKGR